MEGKIDGVNLQLGFMREQATNHNQRLNTHSERITALEQNAILKTGEQNGVEKVVKVGWAIVAVLFTGGLLTVGTFLAWLAGAFNG